MRNYGLGYKGGVEFRLPSFEDRVNLNARVNYRSVKVGDYDFSGMEVTLVGEILF